MSKLLKLKLYIIKTIALVLGLKATQVRSSVVVPFPATTSFLRGYKLSHSFTVYVSPKSPLMIKKTEGKVIYLKGKDNAPHDVN